MKMINDITTDFDQPPQFHFLSKKLPERSYHYPSSFQETQKELHSKIQPIKIHRPAVECYRICREILPRRFKSWELAGESEERLSLEYTDTTPIFRFKDDLVIEFREAPEAHCVVHMRSKSRKGRSDLGKNASRIGKVLRFISERLQ